MDCGEDVSKRVVGLHDEMTLAERWKSTLFEVLELVMALSMIAVSPQGNEVQQ